MMNKKKKVLSKLIRVDKEFIIISTINRLVGDKQYKNKAK